MNKTADQFAGPVFSFPLTREQLQEYLSDSHRYVFKVVHATTNTTIGHGEVYKTDEQNGRLCRILIGNKDFRGRGYGSLLTKLLTEWGFNNLPAKYIDLNVYDFNTSAIKSYEKIGFKKVEVNEESVQVGNESWTSYTMKVGREEYLEHS